MTDVAYDQVAAILARRTAMRATLNTRAETAALRVIEQFAAASDAWYDHRLISEMTGLIVQYVEAAQVQAAQLTDAFLLQIARDLRPAQQFRSGGPVIPGELRVGATHEAVYGRLADQYRYLRSTGMLEPEILKRITQRARILVGTDLQLALRNQSMRWMYRNDLKLWRRVIRPELAKESTCGLCVVASDRIYYRGDLMPIHDRCGCDVLPIVGRDDPGRFLNTQDLDALYDVAGSTLAEDLKDVRVKVVEHGELGPVLVDARHRFRGPGDLAA